MIDAGVDYAVLDDRSISVCHVIDGIIHDMFNDVAGIMNRSIATGLMFCKRRRINFRIRTNRGFESNPGMKISNSKKIYLLKPMNSSFKERHRCK
jgi:hypothetical protein